MDDTITTIYCLCEDFLKAMRYRKEPATYVCSHCTAEELDQQREQHPPEDGLFAGSGM